MDNAKSISFCHPASIVATCFGVGKSPFAPGTWGSLLAYPVAYIWILLTNYYFFPTKETVIIYPLLAIAILFALGTWASHVYAKITAKQDPGEIVIDELVSQLLVILFTVPLALSYDVVSENIWFNRIYLMTALIGPFLLFRLFDIIKPWPANWCDKNVKGGFGIMLDDLVAAIMAIVIFDALIFVLTDFHIIKPLINLKG